MANQLAGPAVPASSLRNAIIATALCFGLTLVLDGLVNHVIAESSRIVALFHADQWLVSSGGSGPLHHHTPRAADDGDGERRWPRRPVPTGSGRT